MKCPHCGAEIGSEMGRKAALTRWSRMTPEERSAAGRKSAKARWSAAAKKKVGGGSFFPGK